MATLSKMNLEVGRNYDWSSYELLSGDTVVCRFDGPRTITVDNRLCPVHFMNNEGSLKGWLERRAIDDSRENAKRLKDALRVEDQSKVGTVLHNHAVKLTDNFWVRKKGEQLCWEDVQVKANPCAFLALRGEHNGAVAVRTSPELTNTGSSEKCWKKRGQKWLMIKAGSEEETYSEFAAGQIGKLLNVPVVEYTPLSSTLSSSVDFTEGKYNAQSLADVFGGDADMYEVYDYLEGTYRLGHAFMDMLLLDAVCGNSTRNADNIQVLTEMETGEFVGLAPAFGFNSSFIGVGTPRTMNYSNQAMNALVNLINMTDTLVRIPSFSKSELEDALLCVTRFPSEFEECVVKMVLENLRRLRR